MTHDTRLDLYGKELQFGEIMLKRAKRRIAALERGLAATYEFNSEFADMEREYSNLREEIAVFEQELANAYSGRVKRDWSVL